MVAHICNPNQPGQIVLKPKPAWTNSSKAHILKKNPNKKKDWWSGSRCRPQVKTLIWKKKKKKKKKERKKKQEHYLAVYIQKLNMHTAWFSSFTSTNYTQMSKKTCTTIFSQ
jgi:hypothetical protein